MDLVTFHALPDAPRGWHITDRKMDGAAWCCCQARSRPGRIAADE